MNEIKVSVIMPVYNTEKYIGDALLSIVNQTLREIEIIIVNDGSTDGSLAIIANIAKSDCRILVYDQENKGQALARNVGLKKASGEYIYLMDSDDLLEKDALETCYKKSVDEKLDFMFFDAEVFSEDQDFSFPLTYDRKGKIEEIIYLGLDILNHLLDIGEYRVPPWLYFIKKSFLRSVGFTFVPGLLHEDQVFVAQLFVSAQRVGYLPRKFFHRRLRPNSIMTNKYSMRNVNTYYTVTSELLQFAEDKSDNVKKTIDNVIKYTLNAAIYNANTFSFRERMMILKTCRAKYTKYLTLKTKVVLLIPPIIKIKTILNRVRI